MESVDCCQCPCDGSQASAFPLVKEPSCRSPPSPPQCSRPSPPCLHPARPPPPSGPASRRWRSPWPGSRCRPGTAGPPPVRERPGGAAADDAHIAVARNRTELIAALGGDAATNGQNAVPKIVFVSGRIDLARDAAGTLLTCADYADPEYSL